MGFIEWLLIVVCVFLVTAAIAFPAAKVRGEGRRSVPLDTLRWIALLAAPAILVVHFDLPVWAGTIILILMIALAALTGSVLRKRRGDTSGHGNRIGAPRQ